MIMIIDGHNLISKIPETSLADPDDEEKLVRILQDYCRVRRKTIEVYFDAAPAGWSGERRYGLVRAHFVRSGITADEAIMDRLRKLGKRARNVIVVSSDRQVQQAARAAHAEVTSSEDFAADWQSLQEETPGLDPNDRLLTEEELAVWEAMFKRGHPPAKGD